jgi:hypothetical protein
MPALERPHQDLERLAVAVDGLARDVFERQRSRHPESSPPAGPVACPGGSPSF